MLINSCWKCVGSFYLERSWISKVNIEAKYVEESHEEQRRCRWVEWSAVDYLSQGWSCSCSNVARFSGSTFRHSCKKSRQSGKQETEGERGFRWHLSDPLKHVLFFV